MIVPIIRVEEWASLLLAVAGAALGIWFAHDNWLDLRAYRAKGWNGFADLAATIGVRSGRSKAILHVLLAVVPAFGLLGSPPAGRYAVVLTVFAAVGAAQAVVIVAQVLNQRDRVRLRGHPSDESTGGPQSMEHHEIENRFRHHPPRTQAHVAEHEHVRGLLLGTAHELNARLPEGRSKSLALTALEEAGFHSHAALARARADDTEGDDETPE